MDVVEKAVFTEFVLGQTLDAAKEAGDLQHGGNRKSSLLMVNLNQLLDVFSGTNYCVDGVQFRAELSEMYPSPFYGNQRHPTIAKIEPNIDPSITGSTNTLQPDIAWVTVSDALGINPAKEQVRVNTFNWWQREYFQHSGRFYLRTSRTGNSRGDALIHLGRVQTQ